MDTVKGEKWVADYAAWIRVHEAKLGDAARKALITSTAANAPATTGGGIASSLWSVVGLGSTATAVPAPATRNGRSSQQPIRPLTLRLNPHYLYYLLIQFEALGLPVGSLDIKIPASARPTSYFSYVSAPARDKDDTMSMSSFRSRMSVVSSSFSLGSSSWWGGASAGHPPDPNKDIKYIYAALTKIPSLRLGPIPATKLIQEFEDCPGKSAVPLDVFKNLHFLELEDVDPRTLIGWDRASMQLRSLTCKKSGLEDLTDLAVNLVVLDARRRRGERVDLPKRKLYRGVVDSSTETETETDADTDIDAPARTAAGAEAEGTISRPVSPSPPPELPSLSWHFLRHLNISNNSLTFVPSMPLKAMQGLTHLDLSSNLLNVVPPALAHLPNLTSLNVNDNLIDSVLGIYDTLKAIKVLNLAKNRLESLCGLERLYTLQRIDLRTNCIYEAGEVGRLAPLPSIQEVWIKDNPLEDELLDYRVECFVEFAKEGRSVGLDGEGPGFFERQRIAEKVPSAMHVLDSAARRSQSSATAAEEEARAELEARQAQAVVKSVKHRGSTAQRKGAEKRRGAKDAVAATSTSSPDRKAAQVDQAPPTAVEGPSAAMARDGSKDNAAAAARRRNRRVVDLEGTPKKAVAAADAGAHDASQSKSGIKPMSESDLIKQAAQGNGKGAASPVPASTPPVASEMASAPATDVEASDNEAAAAPTAATSTRRVAPRSPSRQFQRPSSMYLSSGGGTAPSLASNSRLTWSKKAGAAAASLSMDEPGPSSSPAASDARGAGPSASSSRGGEAFQNLFAIPPHLGDLPLASPRLGRSNTTADATPSSQSKPQTVRRRDSGSNTVGRSGGRLAFLRDASIPGGDLFESSSGSSSGGGGGFGGGGLVDADSYGRRADASEAQATARLRVPRPGTSSAAALARRSKVTASLYEPSSVDLGDIGEPVGGASSPTKAGSPNGGEAQAARSPLPSLAEAASGEVGPSGAERSEAFRRRIEALKGEVGDDWLRLLARGGDAAYAGGASASARGAEAEQARSPPEPVAAKKAEAVGGAKGKKKTSGSAGAGSAVGKRTKKSREAEIE
ncbi:uncharacterized protein PFL1_03098 [Pseudozyma flocculosa PF-1]|uniref:L domain-like protein n=2 Tax=Pseudozyma flocculosa TaxID=84751 RepID=A0A5C3F321_9BASI|nr:uncharacterized protein PFL1_03098 [Pseudozyma flocculosa PF-1]EPQ29343.1 hypothetical protein PFL1_03098 [Pseudozyma flocculosa PF-1]SPO37859.1 uncharacterized protein PSFLO_03336 [Pseudozyma flocculosa]